MGKKDAPDPPDYRAAAEAQGDASREITTQQTWANRPNQRTPFGTSDWTTELVRDPATGQMVTQWNQNLALDPTLQQALDDQQALTRGRSGLALSMLDRAGDEFGPMVDWNSFQSRAPTPDVPEYSTEGMRGWGDMDFSNAYEVGDPNTIRQEAEDAIYNRATSRLDPMWEQQRNDLDVKLRNQGLTPGTEAYDRAMGNYNRARTDAYQTAINESIMGGGAESDRLLGQMLSRRGVDTSEIMAGANFDNATRSRQFGEMMGVNQAGFGQEMTAANYQNQIRNAEIAEELQRRGWSLNEINAMISGTQVQQPNMPSFTNATRSETPQYLTAANMRYNADLDQFNAEQAAWQGMMSGASGLGGAFMPWG